MRSFSYTCVKTSFAGEHNYYQKLPAGLIEVYEDNERNLYELTDRSDLKDWKRWYVEEATERYFNRCRLVGRFPSYRLEVG